MASIAAGGVGRPGAIRGRVELRRIVGAPERRPTVAELGSPPPSDLEQRLKSVVYLETAPRGAFEQTVPFLLSHRLTEDYRLLAQSQRLRNFAIFEFALNGAAS